jgi:general secretion pathway protein D
LLQGANRGQINQANAGVANNAIGNNGQPAFNSDLNVDVSSLSPEQIQAVVDAQRGVASERQMRDLQRIQQANIFVTVIQKQNQIIVRTSDPETMEQIADLIRQVDVPTPMVLLEVKIMEITLDDGFTSLFDYEFTDGNLASGGFSNGSILPPAADLFGGGRGLPLVSPTGATVDATAVPPTIDYDLPLTPNGNSLFQIVDAKFRARVQMLENKNRVTTLASPMLMTANNEVSRLFIGNEVPLNRSFSGGATIGGAGGIAQGGANTTIEFRPVGTTLLITPSINADRTVTLRILQERSNIVEDGANVQIPDGNGGFTEQAIDTVNSKTYSGTVVAKDGMSLALGGLIDESVADNRQAVPVLGKLPVIGVLFRDQQTGRRRTETVMMIRPYIFNTPTEASCTSQWLVDEHSLHPSAPDAKGTLGTFSPHEVVRPSPPTTPLETVFRFHSVEPKEY